MWAGISEVVIATEDINPTVRGGGFDYLKRAGIEVRRGLMGAEAREQMASFMNWCERRRPLVTLKAALDANGNVDSSNGPPSRFTSDSSLEAVHELRRRCDAVIVGVNTVIRDNPKLTVRRVPIREGRQPLRVVLDRRLRTPSECALVADDGQTLILHCEGNPDDLGAEVVCLPPLHGAPEGGVDLGQLLDMLGDRGVQRLLVEGGPDVWGRFLDAGLVDEVYLFQSQVDLGEGLAGGIDAACLEAAGLSLCERRESGADSLQVWR